MCVNPVRLKDESGRQYACGKCKECHNRYIQHWTFRLQQELRQTNKGLFLTLTYDYNNIPMNKGKFTLKQKDYQDFLKRLRKELKKHDRTCKYVVCGEYGGDNNRPHYHLLLFGVDITDFNMVNNAWGKGLIHVGYVQPASIAYVFKYSIKGDLKVRDKRQLRQFVAMSKGLGEDFAFTIQKTKTYGIDKNGKSFVRYKKLRTPKPHFTSKLETLVRMPYYKMGEYKMSIPRFYLKAAFYDTTELTEVFLDKMAKKYERFTSKQTEIIQQREVVQRLYAPMVQIEAVKYSISKEKI